MRSGAHTPAAPENTGGEITKAIEALAKQHPDRGAGNFDWFKEVVPEIEKQRGLTNE